MPPFTSPNQSDLHNRVALVTGAVSDIGHAIASLYAENGAKIVLVDKDPEVLNIAGSLAKQGREAWGVCINIASRPNQEVLVDETIQRFGGIDILVNHAEACSPRPIAHLTEEDWDQTFQAHLRIPFMLSQQVGAKMLQRGRGTIINIASQAGTTALANHAAYCASKAAIISLTQVLALEWGPLGISINAISPALPQTELDSVSWGREASIPTRRLALPEEIAAIALFLASDAAHKINGENLVTDGGYPIQ